MTKYVNKVPDMLHGGVCYKCTCTTHYTTTCYNNAHRQKYMHDIEH